MGTLVHHRAVHHLGAAPERRREPHLVAGVVDVFQCFRARRGYAHEALDSDRRAAGRVAFELEGAVDARAHLGAGTPPRTSGP